LPWRARSRDCRAGVEAPEVVIEGCRLRDVLLRVVVAIAAARSADACETPLWGMLLLPVVLLPGWT